MFVTFSSAATSDLVMFSDDARRLLEVIGMQPTARGVLMPGSYAEALRRLAAIDDRRSGPPALLFQVSPESQNSAAGVPAYPPRERLGLAVRAYPLVMMIRRADARNAPVVWHAAADFHADKIAAQG